ncbi:MAG: hypothetical protein M3Y42_03865 [Actinomycetota bacterium]|nr:hypothetical protein [Actinomycetota bacterium]
MIATSHATAPITGILSGSGTDLLRVTVYTDPVPTHPPTELDGLLSPVYDADGHLLDWRLDPTHAEHSVEAADFQFYRSWRSGYSTERFIGERALVQAFLDWAAGCCDVSALQILRLPKAHADFHKALEMGLQIDRARRCTEVATEPGFGIFTKAGHSSASRAFIPTDPPTVLLATGTTTVTIGRDGLSLRQGEDAVFVHGWRADGDGIVANTGDGELALGTSPAARLLRIIGRNAPQAEVRPCPVGTLVAPLLIFLKDAAQLGGKAATGLYVRSTWG